MEHELHEKSKGIKYLLTEIAAELLKKDPNLKIKINFAPVEPVVSMFEKETREESEVRLNEFHKSSIAKNVDKTEYYEFSGMPFGIPLNSLEFPKHNFVKL